MYWVIQYKDMKANEWMAKKPIPPSLQKLPNIEFCASTQLSMLRYRLIRQNKKLKYFTIYITISKNNHCSKKLYFKDHRHHLWRTMCRMIDNNEPHSFDIWMTYWKKFDFFIIRYKDNCLNTLISERWLRSDVLSVRPQML